MTTQADKPTAAKPPSKARELAEAAHEACACGHHLVDNWEGLCQECLLMHESVDDLRDYAVEMEDTVAGQKSAIQNIAKRNAKEVLEFEQEIARLLTIYESAEASAKRNGEERDRFKRELAAADAALRSGGGG